MACALAFGPYPLIMTAAGAATEATATDYLERLIAVLSARQYLSNWRNRTAKA
jgi:hypothetical protein